MAKAGSRSVRRGPGRPRDEARTSRRRDEILRCAVKHFARAGYQSSDLEQVAGELGCAKGTLYRYFPTKRDLFAAATDLVMRELLERLPTEAADPLDLFTGGVRAFLAFFDEHPEYIELIVQERVELKDRRRSTYFAYREAQTATWARYFKGLMDDGRMRPMPPEAAVQLTGDLLYGSIFTKYFTGSTRPLVDRTDTIIDLVFDGLLTPAERQRRAERTGKKGKSRAR